MKAIECPHWSYAGPHGGNCAINKFKRPSHGVCAKLCAGKLVEITVQSQPIAGGAGTELANLIKAKLGSLIKECGGCAALAEEMDRRGPEWCSANIDELEAAVTRNSKMQGPLFRLGARLAALASDKLTPRSLILQAIEIARQKAASNATGSPPSTGG